MTPKKPVPARLWAYLARDASIGVILRRGPGDWVQMIYWDTKNDIFTPGQWIKGRILELNSDLSPDGQLLIYLVSKPHHILYNPKFPLKPDYGKFWTAVSKPPYFTALALWPEAIGGGVFVDNRTVYIGDWINHPDHEPEGLKVITFDSEYFPQSIATSWFERNRWIKVHHYSSHYVIDQTLDMWRKDVDDFKFSLVARNARNPPYDPQRSSKHPGRRMDDNLEFSVIYQPTNQESTLKDVVWADFDQQKRLVLAKAGKLFSAAVVDGELAFTELADFNANQPEAIESPDWAKKW